ncbi:hypothetical protein B0H17DRAFT_1142732 [Mycena rosella]|uniref:Uncharacterized protein n=1 Tax=Mycena rosella TaxID=1033263 RepID=A0AAD7CWM5_MYCRO|nr:hypothetical protein B0H17DRAFT_1142732 [Mycena rosella]
MSARMHHTCHCIHTQPAFASVPFASVPAAAPQMRMTTTACQAPGPAIAPSGQTLAHSFAVLEANGKGPFYPAVNAADADEALLHTHASFREDPIVALSGNMRRDDTWTLCIPVPAPSTPNPTLVSLNYLIKYATTGDDGNATVQTDVLLTTTALSAGVVPGAAALGVYRPSAGYVPRMVDAATAHCLATTLAVKCNGSGEQWSHFLDAQQITPNVRVGAGAQAYIMFHVAEYPTARMMRSLAVEVSATWQKEEVERKAKEEADKKVRESEAKAAQEEAEKKAREAAEKLAREEERQWREEERLVRKAEAEERANATQAREAGRVWREEARQARIEAEARARKPSVEAAPHVADVIKEPISLAIRCLPKTGNPAVILRLSQSKSLMKSGNVLGDGWGAGFNLALVFSAAKHMHWLGHSQ